MAIHITSPYVNNDLSMLPGKDDNFYEFYGDNADDVANYPGYYYKVDLYVGTTYPAVKKEELIYKSLGSEHVKINIKPLIAPYFNIYPENDGFEDNVFISTSDRVLLVYLSIKAYDENGNTPEGNTSVVSSNIYYYNGTSFDEWTSKNNNITIQAYIPGNGTYPGNRPDWIGPMKPNATALTSDLIRSSGSLNTADINEAYEISRNNKRTATAILQKNQTYFNNRYQVNVFDENGVMTKFGISPMSHILPAISGDDWFRYTFLTFPVGVPQINALASETLEDDKIYFQRTAHGIEIGSQKYIDEKDKYYQVGLVDDSHVWSTARNYQSVPLTFKICDIEGAVGAHLDLSSMNILYYSKLGGWWQITCHSNRNYKETDIKTSSYATISAPSAFSRDYKTVSVDAKDSYIIHTKWLSKKEICEVEDMIQSPEIYLVQDVQGGGSIYIPVHLADSTYKIDTTNKNYLKSYTFTFITDYTKNTIR